jgi:hypothetical protein
MDICWRNLPEELVRTILKLSVGPVQYRDGKYIDIKRITIEALCNIYNYTIKRKLTFVYVDEDSWFCEVYFDNHVNQNKFHGLIFDYNYQDSDVSFVAYFSDCIGDSSNRTWIKTIMD